MTGALGTLINLALMALYIGPFSAPPPDLAEAIAAAPRRAPEVIAPEVASPEIMLPDARPAPVRPPKRGE